MSDSKKAKLGSKSKSKKGDRPPRPTQAKQSLSEGA
jgi:hypothetical protein